MKCFLAIAVLIIAMTLLGQGQNDRNESHEDEAVRQNAKQLEKEFFDAFFQGDMATLNRHLVDDYMQADARARVESRAEVLQGVASRESRAVKLIRYSMDDVAVRVYGNAAVLTAYLSWTAQRGGQETTGSLRLTSVWIKRGQHWLRAAYQGTLVPQQ